MKRRFWFSVALAASAPLAVLSMYAFAQPPAPSPAPLAQNLPPTTVVTQQANGTIVEQTLDGKILRATTARQPNALNFVPMTTADGRTTYTVTGTGAPAADPESLQMATLEQSAAQEARALAAQYAEADSDKARTEAKAKLREKLVAIFDLQQKRRAHEIAKIEERLGKLKDTMKKRDTSKDPIIDRRLDQLTGGVDELGWEESGGNFGYPPVSASPYGYGAPEVPPAPRYPSVVPVPAPPATVVPGR